MSSCDVCASGCKCGSGCSCNDCDCCKMSPTFADEKATTTETMIPGVEPVKGHMDGFEEAEGENAGGKRKCGSNCTCAPCHCDPCSCN